MQRGDARLSFGCLKTHKSFKPHCFSQHNTQRHTRDIQIQFHVYTCNMKWRLFWTTWSHHSHYNRKTVRLERFMSFWATKDFYVGLVTVPTPNIKYNNFQIIIFYTSRVCNLDKNSYMLANYTQLDITLAFDKRISAIFLYNHIMLYKKKLKNTFFFFLYSLCKKKNIFVASKN